MIQSTLVWNLWGRLGHFLTGAGLPVRFGGVGWGEPHLAGVVDSKLLVGARKVVIGAALCLGEGFNGNDLSKFYFLLGQQVVLL